MNDQTKDSIEKIAAEMEEQDRLSVREWATRLRALASQPSATGQTWPSVCKADRERLLYCLRAVRAIADLGRDKLLGDHYPAALTVIDTIRRVLERNIEAPQPSATGQEAVAWSVEEDAEHNQIRFVIGVQRFTIDWSPDGEEDETRRPWMASMLRKALANLAAPPPQPVSAPPAMDENEIERGKVAIEHMDDVLKWMRKRGLYRDADYSENDGPHLDEILTEHETELLKSVSAPVAGDGEFGKALELAASRLHLCAVAAVSRGDSNQYELIEWTDQARAVLAARPAVGAARDGRELIKLAETLERFDRDYLKTHPAIAAREVSAALRKLATAPSPPDELGEDARDAARYRWLRDHATTDLYVQQNMGRAGLRSCHSLRLDAAIDAALAQRQEPTR